MNFDLSIVIPTCNGLHLLRENLPSVEAAARTHQRETGGLTEIIVVDDGGRDETARAIPSEFPDVYLITRQRNQGFAITCNVGLKSSRFPWVALLNNDVRVEEDYFVYQTLHFQDPNVFAVTAKVFEWDQPIFATGGKLGRFRRGFWSLYTNYDTSTPEAGEWIEKRQLLSTYAIGGFSTYSREKLEALGGFNELLSPFHWEDVDLSYRGWKRGWEVHYEPRSIAHHRASATINAQHKKAFVEAAAVRNRLLFHWINLHSPTYVLRHLIMLGVLFVTRLWVLDFSFYRSFLQAVRQLRQVRRLRKLERKSAERTDADLSHLLKLFYQSAPIQIYYSQREVLQKHPEYKDVEV